MPAPAPPRKRCIPTQCLLSRATLATAHTPTRYSPSNHYIAWANTAYSDGITSVRPLANPLTQPAAQLRSPPTPDAAPTPPADPGSANTPATAATTRSSLAPTTTLPETARHPTPCPVRGSCPRHPPPPHNARARRRARDTSPRYIPRSRTDPARGDRPHTPAPDRA